LPLFFNKTHIFFYGALTRFQFMVLPYRTSWSLIGHNP